MYLSQIILENEGPIKEFELNIKEPNQPIIIVGKNGTGKSILLSYIADALYEFGKQAYTDLLGDTATDNYFRILGSINRNVDENFSVAYLKFTNKMEKDKHYEYLETTGEMALEKFKEKYRNLQINLRTNNPKRNEKVTTESKEEYKKIFFEDALGYFMPNRFEKPHWINENIKKYSPLFDLNIGYTNRLGKPIAIENTLEINKQWILGVYLDSLVDIEKSDGGGYAIVRNQNIYNKEVFKTTRNNVQRIIQEIVENDNAVLDVNDRRDRNSRICIKDKNTGNILVPSLDHFSTGQAVLFNLFCSIIRYADIGSVNNSKELSKISGIVVIDEIDLHLHTELQYNVLPKLIKLFPNVQFIISTHSPLFVLGMEREYKNQTNRPMIIEMPNDIPITAERFSEFLNAYECLKRTSKFENDILSEIEEQKEKLKNSNKDMVLYVEGKTDVRHIKNAWKRLYDNAEIPFDIFYLNGADNIKQFLVSYSKEQINKIVVGLLDYDNKGMSVINSLNKNFDNINSDIFKRKAENNINKNAYIITLPTPNEELKKYEYCPIEFLYDKRILDKYEILEKRKLCEINQIYYKQNNNFMNNEQFEQCEELWAYKISETKLSKNNFAEKIENDEELKKEDFKNFQLLFDKINEIMDMSREE